VIVKPPSQGLSRKREKSNILITVQKMLMQLNQNSCHLTQWRGGADGASLPPLPEKGIIGIIAIIHSPLLEISGVWPWLSRTVGV
jgi:hypothetical protein